MKAAFVLLGLLVLSGCDNAVGLEGGTATYSLVAVNNQSPDIPVATGFTQYRVAIPRASIILWPGGEVEERMEYVITSATSSTRIAATDTTFGHYIEQNGVFDVRLPNAAGAEVYAGTGQRDSGGLRLSRSWKKEGVTVTAELAYFRSN